VLFLQRTFAAGVVGEEQNLARAEPSDESSHKKGHTAIYVFGSFLHACERARAIAAERAFQRRRLDFGFAAEVPRGFVVAGAILRKTS
jgi:hypothetical protein